MTVRRNARPGMHAIALVALVLAVGCGGEYEHNPGCYDTSSWGKKEDAYDSSVPCDDGEDAATATSSGSFAR